MSSANSTEADLLPFLAKAKEEDLLTWEEFGNATLDVITATCKSWGLEAPQIAKVQNIHKKHPANNREQGKSLISSIHCFH